MLLYSNKTWTFFNKPVFDGIMNPRIHKIMTNNQDIPYTQFWNNEVCFMSKDNDLSKLKDTIWLNLNNESNVDFKMPVPGAVTSPYGFRKGRNHNGVDMSLKTGDTIYAVWSGKIRYAKYNDGGFGNLVIIRHHNGLETLSAHLSKFLVFPDQDVVASIVRAISPLIAQNAAVHPSTESRNAAAPKPCPPGRRATYPAGNFCPLPIAWPSLLGVRHPNLRLAPCSSGLRAVLRRQCR